jgi:hypothetical protein
MATKPVKAKLKTSPVQPTLSTEELIQQRAYRLYEERGREDGHAEKDWLQAELEIVSQQSRTTAAA